MGGAAACRVPLSGGKRCLVEGGGSEGGLACLAPAPVLFPDRPVLLAKWICQVEEMYF